MHPLSMIAGVILTLVVLALVYQLGRWSQARQELEYLSRFAPFWTVFDRIYRSGRGERRYIAVLCRIANGPEECARADEVLRKYPRFLKEFSPALDEKWDASALQELEELAGVEVAKTQLVISSYRKGSRAYELAFEMISQPALQEAV